MILQPQFIPITGPEKKKLGISEFDIILITGDAYIDHPSFGVPLLARVLWDAGFTVGIIARPGLKGDGDFTRLGRPRLFFGISSGNVDSMVNNFTPNLKRRSDDVYAPRGVPRRPDRATIVYANRVHKLFPEVPIIIGGIEASLRRFAHYDYWQDRVRQSVLSDAPADLLVFGMGERQLIEIAKRLAGGAAVSNIRDIPGTEYRIELSEWEHNRTSDLVELPGFTEVAKDKAAYARAFALHYAEQDPFRGRKVAQPHPKTVVIQNPPALPLSPDELDQIYELPFTRKAHPSYPHLVPALEPVQFSITTHRGCFGACSFCALTHHQGRIVQSRTAGSIIREVMRITRMPEFKGIIQDIGGPTANMFGLSCPKWKDAGACRDKNCSPACPSLSTSHRLQCELLQQIRAIPAIKKAFIGSGIRFDLVMSDDSLYLGSICEHHISGHLKVAPEHIAGKVTRLMIRAGIGIIRVRNAQGNRTARKNVHP